jgi:hypothetical protein
MSDSTGQTQAATPIDLVASAAGRMIGRYEVVSVLGQGGFGIPYRARDAQLGREVAIKEYLPLALAVRQDGTTVLPRSTTAAQDFAWGRGCFVAEGRTLASLQNGHRVDIFQTATRAARFEGNSITGSGPEHNSGGRTCDISLTRAQ